MGPTLTSDRECGACAANTYKTADSDDCVAQPSGGPGKGIANIGDARTQRTFGNCAKKQFQPYQDGACQPCILGASFLADPKDTECTWVLEVHNIAVEFTYTAPSSDDLSWATKNFRTFSDAIKDKLFTAAGGREGSVRNIARKRGGRRERKTTGTTLTAEMDILAHKDLTEASYALPGGLDFEFKSAGTDPIKLTFKLGSNAQAPFTITGPGAANSQPNKCTETVAATKLSDRQCKEFSSDDETTTTPPPEPATDTPRASQLTTVDPNAETTIDSVQEYLDQQNAKASALANGDGGGNSSLVIIIAIVVVLVIVIAAVAFLMVRKNGNGGMQTQAAQSFENPMYDQAHGNGNGQPEPQPAYGAQAAGGYMDVGGAVGGGGGGESFDDPTYSEASAAGLGGGSPTYDVAQPNTGYMDVQVGNQAGSSGYMDVVPQAGGGYNDESDEEV